MENNQRRRVIHLLPNLLTSSSIFAAFLAIIFSGINDPKAYTFAGVLVFISAIFDGLDGKVARLTGSTSEFGVQLDSLADCVAFGVAPAVLAYNWQLNSLGNFGIAAGFLLIICATFRLARFNVNVSTTSKKFFVGLPSPAAGCTVASLVLFAPIIPDALQPIIPYLCIFVCIVVSLLMVSRVRYYAFKELTFFKLRPFRSLVGIILIFCLIISTPRFFLFFTAVVYISFGLLYTYVFQPRYHERFIKLFKAQN